MQLVGLHLHLRRLPGPLRRYLEAVSLGCVLGRLDPSIPSLLHRCLLWSCHRCRLLSPLRDRRIDMHHRRTVHDVAGEHVLAGVPRTRIVLGPRKWPYFVPVAVAVGNVLRQEACICHCHSWLRGRIVRRHLPCHHAAASAPHRLPLDNTHSRLSVVGNGRRGHRVRPLSPATEDGWAMD